MDVGEHWPLHFKTLFEMILQVIMIDHGYTFSGSKKFVSLASLTLSV